MRTLAAFSVVAVAVAAATPAHAGTGDKWTIPTYEHNGLAVNMRNIELKSNGKIWFKLSFVNNTDKTMIVDPDQFQARLPDGRSMTRTKGVFDSMKHGAVTIGPHLSADVNAEYQVGATTKKVTLALLGVNVEGRALKLPDLVAQPADRPWSAHPYQSAGLKITVTEAVPTGKEDASLEIKATFANMSSAPMWVDKSQIKAKLPDGSTVPCEMGLFDKKGPKVVQAGRSEDMKLEFKVGHPSKVALILDGVNLQGAPHLPELVLEQ